MRTIEQFQIRKIYAIGNALGIKASGSEDELHALVSGVTGKDSIKSLTYQEACAVIARLEQKERRRSTGKVDRLPPELKDTVEQMLLTGCTYKEIVAFLKENGEEMSQMAICTYAKKYLATVEMITVAQSNFSMLMDEMSRYPDLDTSEALIRLASHHVMNALTNVDEEQMKEVPIEKLIKETNGLIRAAAYKKRIEVQNRDNYEAGLEAVKSLVFEAMAKENPELYRQVSAYLNKKKNEGLEG